MKFERRLETDDTQKTPSLVAVALLAGTAIVAAAQEGGSDDTWRSANDRAIAENQAKMVPQLDVIDRYNSRDANFASLPEAEMEAAISDVSDLVGIAKEASLVALVEITDVKF